MAEEAVKQDELEPILEPEGGEPKEPETPDPVEEEARAKGWKPEDEYEGPTGGFVGAKEFLQREPLFDKIKNQSKELKRLQKTMEAVSSQFRTQVEAQVKLRVKELQAQKREAIKDQDVDLVEQIDAAIKQEEASAPAQETAQVPDEVSEWISERAVWFDKDVEMTDAAVEASRRHIARYPGDIVGSLDAADRAVKRQFPDYFKEKKKQPPSPTSNGGEPKDSGGKKNWSVGRLSEDQKLVYNQWVKRDKFLSHDEFFQGLEEQGELS